MEVWYIAHFRGYGGVRVECKEFARSTDKMLIDEHGNKNAKETTYDKAFLVWEDARDFLLGFLQERVNVAERALERERQLLAEVQALTNPEAGG